MAPDIQEEGRDGRPDLQLRAQAAWQRYLCFRAGPGQKCADCWLLSSYCCCSELQGIQLRQQVVVLMHHAELNRRRASNTAKLLLCFGARLLVWGLDDHERQLQELLADGSALVLFPSPDAKQPAELRNAAMGSALAPKCIVVLDGGWKETRKMNQTIDPRVTRCCVATATRDECGGTRKYKNGDRERVQTAGAFIALLRELGEDDGDVMRLLGGLSRFLASFERQLRWSGIRVEDMRMNLPHDSPDLAAAALHYPVDAGRVPTQTALTAQPSAGDDTT